MKILKKHIEDPYIIHTFNLEEAYKEFKKIPKEKKQKNGWYRDFEKTKKSKKWK